MRIGIGIVAVMIAVAMLVSIPSATAGEPREVVGIVAYEDGTWVPDGWPGWAKNVNRTYNAMPFSPDPPGGTLVNPFLGNIYVTIEYDTVDDYIRVNCTSPDGRWFGENTRRYGDAYDPVNQWLAINVTVYEVPVETANFTKSLPLGWNLISLPLTALNNGTSAVLGNETIAYDAAKSYNAATHHFEDATTMDPGTGYFVHVTTAGTWEYEGTSVSSTSPGLKSGLNMIGVPNCTMSVGDAMGSADYRYAARWNADDQKYEVYNPSAPAAFHGFTTMTAGEGYFVSAKSVDSGFAISCPS